MTIGRAFKSLTANALGDLECCNVGVKIGKRSSNVVLSITFKHNTCPDETPEIPGAKSL